MLLMDIKGAYTFVRKIKRDEYHCYYSPSFVLIFCSWSSIYLSKQLTCIAFSLAVLETFKKSVRHDVE